MSELTFEQKKALPGYGDGYWAGIDETPIPSGASEGYRYGHDAATRARAMLEDAGFKRSGSEFTRTFPVSK